MEFCYLEKCKNRADFICSCKSNLLVCKQHVLSHQDMGFHSLQLLYTKLDKPIQDKAIKVLSSTVASLNEAILIAKHRSEELIERINLSLASTLTSLYTQKEYYEEMLNKCKSSRGISKVDYKNLWRMLNILGSRDLWKITDYTGDVLVNPILISLREGLKNLSRDLNDKVEIELIQKASSNFVFREMMDFVAQLKNTDLETSIKNAQKVCNKLKSPEFLRLPLEEFKVFRPNFDKFSGLGIMFNFKEELIPDLSLSPVVGQFLQAEFTKTVIKTAKNLNKLKHFLPEVLGDLQMTNMVEFISGVHSSFSLTNQELIRMLLDKYEFMPYCNLIKQFFLFGQGDFYYLMFEELFINDRIIDLDSLLEECYWKSNAKKIPEKLFKSLTIKQDDDFTALDWESYKLDLDLKYPLSLFIPKEVFYSLNKIFSFIWQLRRVDFTLKQISYKRKLLSFRLPSTLKSLLHRMNLLRFRLTSFINVSLFFFMEEVIEVAWKRFVSLVVSAEDLEDLDLAIKDLVKYVQLYNFIGAKALYSKFFNLLRLIIRFVDLQQDIEKSLEKEAKVRSYNYSNSANLLQEISKEFESELDLFKSELHYSQNKLFYYFQLKLNEL